MTSNGKTLLAGEAVLKGSGDVMWSQSVNMERSEDLGELEACNLE